VTRVAVVGHTEWVDFIPLERFPRPGEILHAEAGFTAAAGGGGVAAGVLAELSEDLDFFLALGRDLAGKAAAKQFEDRGMRLQVAWRDQPTRRAVTLLQPHGERTIITVGERLEPLGADALDWACLRQTDGVYVTAGDPAALTQARQAKIVVASPRARHAFEGDGPKIDALVFSENDQDEQSWAKRIGDRARLLVATQGTHGGRWWGESEGRWDAAPLPGPPKDSYGAGDSFAAAFTFGLARGDSVQDAAALAAKWGARAMTRVGAP
jgi:ribokinase